VDVPNSESPFRPTHTHSAAYQAGSVALFGMYVIVKYFGKEWINWLLSWYFSIAGVGSVWKVCRVDRHAFFNFFSSSPLVRYFVD
jgi:hypothetical protein